jgi:hypothetical protein
MVQRGFVSLFVCDGDAHTHTKKLCKEEVKKPPSESHREMERRRGASSDSASGPSTHFPQKKKKQYKTQSQSQKKCILKLCHQLI